jgi:hypothetical protein
MFHTSQDAVPVLAGKAIVVELLPYFFKVRR